MTYDSRTYDNRGFSSLDAKHDFDDYMENALDNGGRWDCLDPDNMFNAIGDYDEKPFKADLNLFASAYRKGDYKTCADIFYTISENYCRMMAKHEYNNPESDI